MLNLFYLINMSINRYDKLDLDNIVLDKIKVSDDKKIINVKYKTKNEGKTVKEHLFFSTSTSSLTLVSELKNNLLRGYYLEVLINDTKFYEFILDLEETIKHLILKKSDKILPDLDKEINYNLIDEYHKTNIKFSKTYNNPIIKLNFIKNTKNNNTLIYNSSQKQISEDLLEENKDIRLIIRLDKIVLTNYSYELDLVVEQIKVLSKSSIEPERMIHDYRFEASDEDNYENENNDEKINNEN